MFAEFQFFVESPRFLCSNDLITYLRLTIDLNKISPEFIARIYFLDGNYKSLVTNCDVTVAKLHKLIVKKLLQNVNKPDKEERLLMTYWRLHKVTKIGLGNLIIYYFVAHTAYFLL